VTPLDDVEVELRRIVDRLNTMPLTRADSVAGPCRELALLLVEQTRRLVDDIPVDAEVPDLRVQGFGALIAVLGHDFVIAARRADQPDVTPVLATLVEVRRSLP
jgi:hypothetical protein